MGAITYAALPQDCIDDDSRRHRSIHRTGRWMQHGLLGCFAIIAISFIASVMLNAVLLYQRAVKPWELVDSLPSRYAHLPRNLTIPFLGYTDHESTNRTIQDIAWSDPDLDWGAFYVALEKDHLSALGLPDAAPFPWDTSKSLYVLNTGHELHCLHLIRDGVNEYYHGWPEGEQKTPYAHVIHCLNALRQSVLCNADDTPLYMGRLHANANVTNNHGAKPGVGFTRSCRDWSALLAWSRQHSACYKPIHYGDDSFPPEERWKFCPDGSKPCLNSEQD